MELAGTDASKYEKKKESKMPLLNIILIAVAGAVGLFLTLLACCCVSRSSWFMVHFISHYLHNINIKSKVLQQIITR